MIKSKSCERRVRVSRSRRDVESQLRPGRSARRGFPRFHPIPRERSTLSSVRPSSSERLAITGFAREDSAKCKYNSAAVTRCVCVCLCVCLMSKWRTTRWFFSDMGEAEAPAPPPAVPQNPIKIFISGNSGNKEVRAVQRQSSGRKVSLGFYIFYMGNSGRFLARSLSWTAAKNFLHFPNPRDKTPFPVNFHLKLPLSDCINELMTTNFVFTRPFGLNISPLHPKREETPTRTFFPCFIFSAYISHLQHNFARCFCYIVYYLNQ